MWKALFDQAKAIEAEGDLLVKQGDNSLFQINSTNRKLNKDTKDEDFVENTHIKDCSEPDYGAFNNPKSISSFVSKIKKRKLMNEENVFELENEMIQMSNNSTIPLEEIKSHRIDNKTNPDNLCHQLCRVWLKHHYLQIGKPCVSGDKCLRRHSIQLGKSVSADVLHRDYAFKGLKPKHRKIIIDQILSEQSLM